MLIELEKYSYLLQDYKNFAVLRPGGQKKVFYAEHEEFGKVIIKISKCTFQSDYDRLKREIEFLSKNLFDSFPIVHFYQFNDLNKDLIIIEEFIEHLEFNSIRQFYNCEIKVVTLLFRLICILDILWKRNIIHRDLKPDNILITQSHTIKIIDLGIARFLNDTSLTQTLQFMGPCTPFYAAPEQLRNDKKIIDVRTDLFSLGIIILEILLGFHPFDPSKIGSGSSIPENIINGIYFDISKSGFSENFQALVNRLLANPQYKRFRNSELIIQFITTHWEIS